MEKILKEQGYSPRRYTEIHGGLGSGPGPSGTSTVFGTTMHDTDAFINISKISLEDSMVSEIPAGVGATQYGSMVFAGYQKVPPLSSICRSSTYARIHIEVPPNKDKLLYDKANDYIKDLCGKVPFKFTEVTEFKHHANSWGLSSNNYIRDEILIKMKNLNILDMSETINYQVRSDLC